jgi:hypothetical protein
VVDEAFGGGEQLAALSQRRLVMTMELSATVAATDGGRIPAH